MLLTGIVFLAVLSLLVLVHEFGHFVMGKLAGVGVLEFALGLPFTKPLWSRRLSGGMRLSLYPILFGGFVKLLGEEGQEEDGTAKGRYFYKIGVWQRIAVVVAGVAMNFLLAVAAFYLFLGFSNFRVLVPRLVDYNFLSRAKAVVVITLVGDATPAKAAGLSEGDVVLSVDSREFKTVAAFQEYIRARAGEEVELTLADTNLVKQRQVRITPRKYPPPGQGAIGVAIDGAEALYYDSPVSRAGSGVVYAVDMLGYTLRSMAHLVASAYRTGNVAPVADNISGPVGILVVVGKILELGGWQAILSLINFVGVLSLSLAFMNILPIPALDGGRLAFLLVEAIWGKKMAAQKENLINQIGMVVLLGLIILISFNDVVKWISPLLRH